MKSASAGAWPVVRSFRRALAATLICLGLPGFLSAQTLLHRYSFVSDASDSVSAANGTIVIA